MSNILHLVSIARKAGRVEPGEEPTIAAARAKNAKLILVAQDAAENTFRRVRHVGQSTNTLWVSVPYDKAALGRAIGRDSTAMLALTDVGLAAAILRGLAQDDPEKYAEVSTELDRKAEKALRRQQEKRQHEKNLRTGKVRKKPAPEPKAEAKPAEPPAEQKPEGKPEQRTPRRARPAGKRPGGYHGSSGGKKRHSGRSNPYEHFDTDRRPSKKD